jgi:uncharacterized protein (TIGR01619 family)
MSEHWAFYPSNVEDEPATFLVNLGVTDEIDAQLYRWRVGVTISFESDRDDGFPSNTIAEKLNHAEDGFVAALSDSLSAINVGRLTRARRRDVYFYAPSADGADEAIRAAAVRAGLTVADIRIEEDPSWSGYFEFLCPGVAETQWINNDMLIRQLEEAGDCLTAVRNVDHAADFPTADDRAAFAASITALGFQIDSDVELEASDDPDSNEYPFSLRFSREHAVDLETANDVTIPLSELAAEHNGVYDGWATAVVKN